MWSYRTSLCSDQVELVFCSTIASVTYQLVAYRPDNCFSFHLSRDVDVQDAAQVSWLSAVGFVSVSFDVSAGMNISLLV